MAKNLKGDNLRGPQPPPRPTPLIITPTPVPSLEVESSLALSQEALKKLISDSVRQEVKQTHEPEGPSSCTPYTEEHNLVPYPTGSYNLTLPSSEVPVIQYNM